MFGKITNLAKKTVHNARESLVNGIRARSGDTGGCYAF